MTIYDCRTHVRMTSMTSSIERTDLNFKISVALPRTECIWQRTYVERIRTIYGLPADKRDLKTKSENLKVMDILKILSMLSNSRKFQ